MYHDNLANVELTCDLSKICGMIADVMRQHDT